MTAIQDLVLTFCPTMHSVQQKKLKLLMPVYYFLVQTIFLFLFLLMLKLVRDSKTSYTANLLVFRARSVKNSKQTKQSFFELFIVVVAICFYTLYYIIIDRSKITTKNLTSFFTP